MPLSQRLFLIVGSVLTLAYFVSKIRKSKLKISHSIFWVIFGLALLVLACVPDALFFISDMLGFQSPSNLVYLIVIFLLVIKLFTTTMHISKLTEQVAALTQAMAINELREKEEKTAKKEAIS